jgi:hypothetical protein
MAAGGLAEVASVRTGLACIAVGGIALSLGTVFGTGLHKVKD